MRSRRGKTAPTKLKSHLSLNHTQCVGRTKASDRQVPRNWHDEVSNVFRCTIVQCFVDEYTEFVGNTLTEAQPVQLITNERCDVISSRTALEQSG